MKTSGSLIGGTIGGAANKAGIVQGLGAGRFAPEALISREEMTVMIIRAYTYLKRQVSCR